MTIKNPPAKMFAAILAFVIGSATLYAQNSASTNESETNTVTAPMDSSAIDTNTVSSANFASNSTSVAKANPDSGLQLGGGRNHGSPVEINPRNAMFGKTLIAFTAVVCPFLVAFGLPVAIVVTVFSFRHRQNKLMHETVRVMVEKGVPVTPELIAGLNPMGFKVNIQGKWDLQRYRNRYLLPGLVLSGVGLALMIALPEHSGPGGLIILVIGLAFLIAWLVERKQNPDDQRKRENDQQPPKT